MNRINKSNQLLAETIVKNVMKECEACGVAAAIIDKNGDTQYENYWGYKDSQIKSALNEDTIFGVGSVTKSFTALAIMQLEEKGILKLDDPVGKYIPEFTNKNQKKVTIRHLLTHSGGFYPLPRILVNDVAKELNLVEAVEGDFAYNTELAVVGAKRVAERLDLQTIAKGLNGVPGENFSYSNDGYGLLSDIIRRYGGEASYAEYLNKNVFAPLNMRRSFCDFVKPAQDENAATLYCKVGDIMKSGRDYHESAFVLNGGGAVKSTLKDLKNYLFMYLNEGKTFGGGRVLSEYGIREMCKPRQPTFMFNHYGYGLCYKQMDDLKIIEHGGALPGVSSNIAWSYEAEAAVIVLCNTSSVPVGIISDTLMKMYNGRTPVIERDIYREAQWSEQTIDEASGEYESGEGASFRLYKKPNGGIGASVDGKELNIIPVNSYEAIIRTAITDIHIRLHRNEEKGIFAISTGYRMIPKIL